MEQTGIQEPARALTNTAAGLGIKSKPFEIVPCERVDALLWTWLYVSGERYRRQSGDPSPNGHNLERVREHWRLGGNDMMLWLLVVGSHAFGYAITEVRRGHARECFISEAWVHPDFRNLGAIRQGLTCFEGWGRARNCEVMRFATSRSPRAYARALRGLGWRQEAVFIKPLEVHRG